MSYCEDLCEKSLRMVLSGNPIILRNYRPDWLKNPNTNRNLEIDLYLPELDICIEIQGEHHYYDESQKWRDSFKKMAILEKNLWLIELSILQISPSVIHKKIRQCFREKFLKPFDKSWICMPEFENYRNQMKKNKVSACIIAPSVHRTKNRTNKQLLDIKKYIFAKRWLRVKVKDEIIKVFPLEIISNRNVKCQIKGTLKILNIRKNIICKAIYLAKIHHYDKEFHGNNSGASNIS